MRSVLPVFKSVGSAWVDFHIAAAHGRFASSLCHVAHLPIVRFKGGDYAGSFVAFGGTRKLNHSAYALWSIRSLSDALPAFSIVGTLGAPLR